MKAPVGSLVKPTVDRLAALLRADPAPDGLQDVQILYGPPAKNDQVSADVLQLAPGDFNDPGVTVTRRPEPSAGRLAYRHETEVLVWLATYTGETDMEKLVEHTAAIFDAVAKVVREHQVEDGYWDQLRLGDQESWSPVQSDQGATVVVLFTIVATAIG